MKNGSAVSVSENSDVKLTALGMLLDATGAVGGLVRAYTASDAMEDEWLESWFLQRTRLHRDSRIPEDVQFAPITLDATDVPQLNQRPGLSLVSISPHYFRGFKDLPNPIDLTGGLIVIEGKNSSGKTSLAEAIEFLFEGSLSRREEHGAGSTAELENCIANQFRPVGESTFVEATFAKHLGTPDEQQFMLKRVLTMDYGAPSTSVCESKLHMDGSELSKEDETVILEEMFSLVPPLLMQHTIRSFVHSPPPQRRQYFERILALDDLTDLISKAVVGDAKLPGFKNPKGSDGLPRWETLIGELKIPDAKTTAQKVKSVAQQDRSKVLADALNDVAVLEFSSTSANLADAETWIDQLQNDVRQRSFPPLAQLRPKQQPNHELSTKLAESALRKSNVGGRWTEYEEAKTLTNAVREGALVIADALEDMIQAGLIDREQAVQLCPLCAHENPATLTQVRLLEIGGWKPMVESEKKARAKLDAEITGLNLLFLRDLLFLIKEASNTLPDLPDLDQYLNDVSSEMSDASSKLVKVRSQIETDVRQSLDKAQSLATAETDHFETLTVVTTYALECTECIDNLKDLPGHAEKYRRALRTLETIIGQAASSDDEYKKRESWLACVKSQVDILDDFKWEEAKRSSQKDLADVRTELMKFRGKYLANKRDMFSEGMQEVWSCLREDTYSTFSNLHVPEPRRKGFPVVLEVKATLDDGYENKEIDALKVFSESQVNALGVAAFVTRSRLLGHDFLIFDDPVQSMDEDHFKTFARDVLPPILDEGRQVILLTHNETFARDISYWHHERSNYVTLSMRMSQKDGCLVDEGNRRFSERLRSAGKLAREGELRESWIRVRLAIERLYTVTNIKYGPNGFDPDSWKDQTAEYMWDSGGVRAIITGFEGDAGKRLKEILTMASEGAHDKGVHGSTDLTGATKFLRGLGTRMKITD